MTQLTTELVQSRREQGPLGGAEPGAVLVIWPPQILSYFNAGHRLALYQVAGHLRGVYPACTVNTLDGPVERVTWKDVADRVFQVRYDFVVVMNDFDGTDGIGRLISYIRKISPASRLVTFGRLSSLNPGFFKRYDLDAIVDGGDFETGVAGALDAMLRNVPRASGALLRQDGVWALSSPGTILSPTSWVLPGPDEIPYKFYDELYSTDARKFPGLPQRRELVVPVARGCPIGCSYCEVPEVFGRAERRLDIDRVVTYIRDSFDAAPFEYVSFYAPTFTLNRAWVFSLCERLIALGSPYPWKCCTTMHHLNETMIHRMAISGCVRISVGLETLETSAHDGLPVNKRKSEDELRRLAEWCLAAGVELNCFVVVGLPGTTLEGTIRTVKTAESLGARVRPTVYTPLESMREDISEEEMSALNRQTFVPGQHSLAESELHQAYALVFGAASPRQSAAQRVPQRTPDGREKP